MTAVGDHGQGQRGQVHRPGGADLDPGVLLHAEAGTPQGGRIPVEGAGAAGRQVTGQPAGGLGGDPVGGPADRGTEHEVVGVGGRPGGAGQGEGPWGRQGERTGDGRLRVGLERLRRVRAVAGDLQRQAMRQGRLARRGEQVGGHPQQLLHMG